MAYTINKYNGIPFITVEDGTVDTTTDLKLVGKNYTGYGEIQNENFLHLLESFAGENEPTSAVTGQVWYDSITQKIKVYDGAIWKATGGAEVSATAPAGLAEGDAWWDSTSNQLKVLNSNNEFILVGPQRAGVGTTQMLSVELTEAGTNNPKSVIAAVIGDNIISFTSDDEFVPANVQENLDQDFSDTLFPVIKAGITFRKVDTSTGVSSLDTTLQETFVLWGTASNALRLNGQLATDYLTLADLSTAPLTVTQKFGDTGYTMGTNDELTVYITGGIPNIKLNNTANELRIVNNANQDAYVITNDTIRPASANTKTLGTSLIPWNAVYATTFNGTATQSDTIKEQNSSQYRQATTSNTVNTVAVRDSSGNINATLFEGTATKARYADLAEKYTTAEELAPGTAVAVCTHETHEVGPAKSSDICIGVVSTDPAVMMNSEADGQYIGLKGRLPVRVKGAVKKGQAIYAWEDGVCGTVATTALVGVALESNDSSEEKLVECVLKT